MISVLKVRVLVSQTFGQSGSQFSNTYYSIILNKVPYSLNQNDDKKVGALRGKLGKSFFLDCYFDQQVK